jgi:hypothetical protein
MERLFYGATPSELRRPQPGQCGLCWGDRCGSLWHHAGRWPLCGRTARRGWHSGQQCHDTAKAPERQCHRCHFNGITCSWVSLHSALSSSICSQCLHGAVWLDPRPHRSPSLECPTIILCLHRSRCRSGTWRAGTPALFRIPHPLSPRGRRRRTNCGCPPALFPPGDSCGHRSICHHPPSQAILVAIVFALLFTWAGLIVGDITPDPVRFFIPTFAFGTYLLGRSAQLVRDPLQRQPPRSQTGAIR